MENKAQIEGYQLEEIIGKGKYQNKVWRATELITNISWALKETQLPSCPTLKANFIQASEREYSIMRMIDHPRVIKVNSYASGYIETTPGQHWGWVIYIYIYIYIQRIQNIEIAFAVQELATNGDMFSILKNTGRLSEPVARSYIWQLLSTIQYLHQNRIFHRDLKPENLLLDEEFGLKLCDFDLGIVLQEGDGLITGRAGTSRYLPPEMRYEESGVPYSPSQAEMFTLGVVIFNMVTGAHPYKDSATMDDQLYPHFCINRGNYWAFWRSQFKDPKTNPITEDFISLMDFLLEMDPDNRATLADVEAHEWMKGATPTQTEIVQEMSKRKEYVKAKEVAQNIAAADTNTPKVEEFKCKRHYTPHSQE